MVGAWLTSKFVSGLGGTHEVKIETDTGAATGQYSIRAQGEGFPRAAMNNSGLTFSDGTNIATATHFHRTGAGAVRMGDLLGSNLHTLLANLAYTPAQAGDWNTAPTNVAEALDELAARITALE